MVYTVDVHPKCYEEIGKACKRNPVLKRALERKMGQILLSPQRYKPLRYDFSAEYRVHILKSYVLRFEVDEKSKIVRFLSFAHHDQAYQK